MDGTVAITIRTSSHYQDRLANLSSGQEGRHLLTQNPARAKCLETKRKMTKVDARTIRAIITATTLSPRSAYILKPGRLNTAGGGPDILDGADDDGWVEMASRG